MYRRYRQKSDYKDFFIVTLSKEQALFLLVNPAKHLLYEQHRYISYLLPGKVANSPLSMGTLNTAQRNCVTLFEGIMPSTRSCPVLPLRTLGKTNVIYYYVFRVTYNYYYYNNSDHQKHIFQSIDETIIVDHHGPTILFKCV